MNEMFFKHGAFSWNELMTTDVEAAKKFYGELFNWSFQEFPVGDMVYQVIKTGDREIGGIMKTPVEAQGAPPQWMAYVTVEDVNQTAQRAKTSGAKILVEPKDIPEVGRFCVIQDPQGAVLAAITYLSKS